MLNRNQNGFTIVELLIVIVVIGILAAITVVAFNGVQDRAYDASVQSDLKGLAKKLLLYEADNGAYPQGGGNTFPGIGSFPLSKDAYDTSTYNFYYCEGLFPDSSDMAGQQRFEITAQSKSGNKFHYRSDTGLGNSNYVGCAGFAPGRTNTAGYKPSTGWNAWTNG